MTFPDVSGLPTNLDATYSDASGPIRDHQQHHDLVHAAVKAAPGVFVTAVNHGSDANVARPAGAVRVDWFGTVEPLNAVDGDSVTVVAP